MKNGENSDTKYQSIEATLNAIGKAVFVNFYYDFKNKSLSTEKLAERLVIENPGSTSHKQGFRIPRARHIFKESQQLDALKIIINRVRISPEIKEKALNILFEETVSSASQEDVIADSIYKHYKGNVYRVISIGIHSETLEALVVYQDVNTPHKSWIRPLAEWLKPCMENGTQIKRFSKIDFQ